MSSPFLIESQSAKAYYPYMRSFQRGEIVNYEDRDEEEKGNPKYYASLFCSEKFVKKVPTWEVRNDSFQDVPENTAVVIPIRDLISKYNYCGAPGTIALGNFVKSIDRNPNVTKIIFDIDSPGGVADGTMNFASIIRSCKTATLAFANGMACSAACWIASACDVVMLSDKMTRIGSVGTYRSFYSYKKWLEKEGIVEEDVYATRSTNKNKDWRDAEEGNYETMRESIDKVNEFFIEAIKEYRNPSDEDVFTGKVYMGKDAMTAGLADKIGTIDDAIAYQIVSEDIENEDDINLNNKNKMNKQYKNVNKVLGVESMESSIDGVYLSEEQMASLDSNVSVGIKVQADLQAEQTAHEATQSTLTTTQDSLNAKDVEIQQLTEQLAKKPGSNNPTTTNNNDDIDNEECTSEDPVNDAISEFIN